MSVTREDDERIVNGSAPIHLFTPEHLHIIIGRGRVFLGPGIASDGSGMALVFAVHPDRHEIGAMATKTDAETMGDPILSIEFENIEALDVVAKQLQLLRRMLIDGVEAFRGKTDSDMTEYCLAE